MIAVRLANLIHGGDTASEPDGVVVEINGLAVYAKFAPEPELALAELTDLVEQVASAAQSEMKARVNA